MTLRSLIARPSPSLFAGSDPFALLLRDIDRMFAPPASPVAHFGTGLRMDVTENDKEVTVTAECPGVDEKDIDLSFNDGILTLKGEKKIERDEKTETCHLVERASGSFSRQIAVPSEIAADKISASFAKGVLTISLPKAEKETEKARKIEIKPA